ncbi:hypothetical protein [Paenibacillus sp. 1001270B_150601_E10]|uniref:hypothetical protein n=1 Tax=Paenibacillus sp. 1001270B_150601_E10 TaxID=2787079 RepID=UPI0018A1153E|nr:hypothetical protein [Paenibacillus sp. 1001270B_150601_E10]
MNREGRVILKQIRLAHFRSFVDKIDLLNLGCETEVTPSDSVRSLELFCPHPVVWKR